MADKAMAYEEKRSNKDKKKRSTNVKIKAKEPSGNITSAYKSFDPVL
jgi:hypothetical protein